jgi:hypothetical protein
MQLLLNILEALLPEVASTLAGPESRQLRRRLFRSGVGILLLCLGYLVAVAIHWYLSLDARNLSTLLSVYEIVPLGFLSMFGFALLLLSTIEPKQGSTASTREFSPSSTTIIQVSGVFESAGGRSSRKVRSAKWSEYLNILKGANPENIWTIVVDGIEIHISFSISTGVRASQAPTGGHTLLNVEGSWNRLKIRMMLVDEKGTSRDIEVCPKGTLTPRIEVRIDGGDVLSDSPGS